MTRLQIKSRFFLLALLVSAQAACLIVGLMWATGWLWDAFERVVNESVSAEGRAQTHQLALQIQELGLDAIEPGTADWEKLQTICEETKFSHGGFLCILRRDNGALLCHPQLKQDPGLLRLNPGHNLLWNVETSGPITKLAKEAESLTLPIVTGHVDLDGVIYLFTGFSMPRLNIVLAVYQPEGAIEAFTAAVIQPVMQVGYGIAVFIIGATGMITVFLINRYEASLAEINVRLERKVDQRTRALIRTRNALSFGLAKLAESRDKDTGKHLERIRSYVSLLTTELARTNPDIDRAFVADLAVASSLHDIGKVGIPDGILLKPGRLTPAERKAMQMHTTLGSECLSAIRKQLEEDDFLELAEQIAASHHEHWDGSGYPHGLQGREIPLAGRIVALADVYDALTSDRTYKQAVSHEEARDWIVTRYAQQFDPAVVEAFVAREKDFRRVCESCRDCPESPVAVDKTAEPSNADTDFDSGVVAMSR